MGIRWHYLSPYQQSLVENPSAPRAEILKSPFAQTERDHQRRFARECKARGWRCVWHSTAKASTANRGTPDFIVAAHAETFWLEFKLLGEELSPEQRVFARELAANGVTLHLVTSAEEAVALIEGNRELPVRL
jgi:hypothetical protein